MFFPTLDDDDIRTFGTEDTIKVEEGSGGQKVGSLSLHAPTNQIFIDASEKGKFGDWWCDNLEVNIKFENFVSTDGKNPGDQEIILRYPAPYPWFSGSISCTGPGLSETSTFEYKSTEAGKVEGSMALTSANNEWCIGSGSGGKGKGGKTCANKEIGVFDFTAQSLVNATFLVDVSYTNKNLGVVKMIPDAGSAQLTRDGDISDGVPQSRSSTKVNMSGLNFTVNDPPEARAGTPVISHQLIQADYDADTNLDEGYYTLSQDFNIGVHHDHDDDPHGLEDFTVYILFKIQKSAGKATGKKASKNTGIGGKG